MTRYTDTIKHIGNLAGGASLLLLKLRVHSLVTETETVLYGIIRYLKKTVSSVICRSGVFTQVRR